MASLALERVRCNGSLNVRQREDLRRVLAEVAGVLRWDMIGDGKSERIAKASRDLTALAEAGAGSLEQDIIEHISEKGAEIRNLSDVASALNEMSADSHASYPATIDYSRTARDSLGRFITKTETLTLADRNDAQRAAATLVNGLETWEKLRDQMVDDLQQQKREILGMKRGLPTFVESHLGMLTEVIAILN